MSLLRRFTPLTGRATAFSPIVCTKTTPALAIGVARSISSTTKLEKDPVEATKETLKKVDKTASNAALKGIDLGEKARDKLKDTIGSTSQEAKAKSEEVKGEAAEYVGKGKGKAEEVKGELKGEAAEYAGRGKGKAEEAVGSAAGKAKETVDKTKGKAQEYSSKLGS